MLCFSLQTIFQNFFNLFVEHFRIKDRDEVLNARELELESLERNMKENKETITNLEMEEPKLTERFHMYQHIRGYVRDLLECISAKVTLYTPFAYRQKSV